MKVLLIDAHSLFYRALYGFLSNKNYNSIQRFFLNELWTYRNRFPGFVPVYVWDGGSKRRLTITTKAKEDGLIKDIYKSNRKEIVPVEDLMVLIHSAKELLNDVWCAQIEVRGDEADDIIFTYCQNKDFEKIVIISTDGDFTQCLEKGRVVIYNHTNGEFKNEDSLKGMTKEQWLQASALVGDASDSICGVTGWGKKFTYEAVKVAGSVDAIKESIEKNGAKSKREKKLIEEWELYNLSLLLKTSVKIDNLPLIDMPICKDEEVIKQWFFKFGQLSWLGREKILSKGE